MDWTQFLRHSKVLGMGGFYTPVFRRDVLWYGDVRPSVRPGLCPSVRHSFPHFSPTCFDIFFWNFVYHFIFMHVRSSSNAINFRHFLQELCSFLTSNSYKYAVFRTFLLHALTYWVQILYMTLLQCTTEQVWVSSFCNNFLLELCLFVNLEYSKYSVFRTFLLHALTYWAEILHMTLFYCTTDQVRVSSICVNICGSYAPFWNLEYWKYTVFRTFLLHPFTYWAESLHITLFFSTTDQVWVSSICVYFGVMPLFELRIL